MFVANRFTVEPAGWDTDTWRNCMLNSDKVRHDDRHAPPIDMITNVPITFLDFPSTKSEIHWNMIRYRVVDS